MSLTLIIIQSTILEQATNYNIRLPCTLRTVINCPDVTHFTPSEYIIVNLSIIIDLLKP